MPIMAAYIPPQYDMVMPSITAFLLAICYSQKITKITNRRTGTFIVNLRAGSYGAAQSNRTIRHIQRSACV